MNKTKTLVGILALIALVGGGIFILSKSDEKVERSPAVKNENSQNLETLNPSEETGTTAKEVYSPESPTTKASGFTLNEVQMHSSESSCWSAISGKVYDLTPWIDEHPGGDRAILSICGIDGTEAYLGHHGGQEKPEGELAKFLIGDLI